MNALLEEAARRVTQHSPDQLPIAVHSTNECLPQIDTLVQPPTDKNLTEPIDTSKIGAAVEVLSGTVLQNDIVQPETDPEPEMHSNEDSGLLLPKQSLINNHPEGSEAVEGSVNTLEFGTADLQVLYTKSIHCQEEGCMSNSRKMDTGFLELLATLAINPTLSSHSQDATTTYSEVSPHTDIGVNLTDNHDILAECQELDLLVDDLLAEDKSKGSSDTTNDMSPLRDDCPHIEEATSALAQDREPQPEVTPPISLATISPEPCLISKRSESEFSNPLRTPPPKRQKTEEIESKDCIIVRCDFENVLQFIIQRSLF